MSKGAKAYDEDDYYDEYDDYDEYYDDDGYDDYDTAVASAPAGNKKGKNTNSSSKQPVATSSAKTSPVPAGAKKMTQEPSSKSTSPSASLSSPVQNKSKQKEQVFVEGQAVAAADGKQCITIVITGHVDSGKSTILGHALVKLGKFSDKYVDKVKQHAAENQKATFWCAYLLDQSEEERRRGVTIDAGSQCFDTEHKHVSILDAPGHKDYITNMITSATQADAALLIITAQRGEFESGLHNGTEDHLMVLKTLGVSSIVVVVNKMDTCEFSKERFDDVLTQLAPVIEKVGYEPSVVRAAVPVSGLLGINLIDTDRQKLPWYTGPSLCDIIDEIPVCTRYVNAPLRLSVQDVDKGIIYGRVESGKVTKGDSIVFIPPKLKITVRSITLQSGGATNSAVAGSLVEIGTKDDISNVTRGDVGCPPQQLIECSTDFEARVDMFGSERLKRSVLPGSTFQLGLQSITVHVTVEKLIEKYNKDGKPSKGMLKSIPAEGQGRIVLRAERPLPLEPAEKLRALGRFVLRQEDETVGGGIVLKVLPQALDNNI